jgi:hypothetical protein
MIFLSINILLSLVTASRRELDKRQGQRDGDH